MNRATFNDLVNQFNEVMKDEQKLKEIVGNNEKSMEYAQFLNRLHGAIHEITTHQSLTESEQKERLVMKNKLENLILKVIMDSYPPDQIGGRKRRKSKKGSKNGSRKRSKKGSKKGGAKTRKSKRKGTGTRKRSKSRKR
jgi:hypothetical protein